MGDVVVLTTDRRPPRPRRSARRDEDATVALFTGVRIERWDDPPPRTPAPGDEPTTPGGRRPRRRSR